MKNKILNALLSVIVTLSFIFGCVPQSAECSEYTVDEVQNLIDGIISYKLSEAGAGNVQDWINGSLSSGAGTISEWYIMSLSQLGYRDFSAYENSLISYLDNNNIASASSRLKYALALSASGSGNSYISEFLDNSPGEQGIMSWIYGLHVLNNGYTSEYHNTDSVINTLLSLQYSDGGWAIFGEGGDVDVTAMTIQALAPHYYSNDAVKNAVDRGLELLSQRQQDDGGYQSFGTANPESASQVLTALSAININCQYDDRFIKNGNNIIDGITKYRLENGSFRHTIDGEGNETATIQALYALISYKRQNSFHVFDNRRAQTPPETAAVTEISETSEIIKENTETANIQTVTAIPDEILVSYESSSASLSNTELSLTSVSETSLCSSVSKSESVTALSSTKLSETTNTERQISTTAEIIPVISKNKNYKPTAIIIIISAGVLISLILFLSGKRNYKNFIFILIAVTGGIIFIAVTDFQSAENYYSNPATKENIAGTVSFEIRCDTIVGKSDSEYIPDNGVILEETNFEFEEGDTVFDILTDAARKYQIQTENKGSSGNAHGMVYISGINYIYEFDFGDLSGWVYHVNGISPSVSCGEYTVHDGDHIEWLYTCELGHDLNEVYE